MEKKPEDLSDDELIQRLREDSRNIRPGKPIEDNAPVDLEAVGDEEAPGPGLA